MQQEYRWESWWCHQMETFSALLALCDGNTPVTGGIPWQRPVRRSFDVFFVLCLNKRLSKQSRHRWFETPSRSLWRHCNVLPKIFRKYQACVSRYIYKRLLCFIYFGYMMTSLNGNIFRVSGPLWGELTGDRWIPLTKASDAELWCFLWSAPE